MTKFKMRAQINKNLRVIIQMKVMKKSPKNHANLNR